MLCSPKIRTSSLIWNPNASLLWFWLHAFFPQIGSDSSANYSVYYEISGPGVTEPPVKLFSVDRDTGMLKIHGTVNREQYPQFIVSAEPRVVHGLRPRPAAQPSRSAMPP